MTAPSPVINRADQALYQAKDAGRNTVMLAGPASDQQKLSA